VTSLSYEWLEKARRKNEPTIYQSAEARIHQNAGKTTQRGSKRTVNHFSKATKKTSFDQACE